MNKKITVLLFSLVMLMALSATGCQAKPAALSDEQVVEITENILTAINDADYGQFVQDFGAEMVAAIPEDDFIDMRSMLQDSSGNFGTCQSPTLLNNGGYALYRMICEFDQENVVVTVTFAIGGDKVEGLFFDSPNLRELNP